MNDEINKAVEILRSGGIILFPSDTYWSIGCDAQNENAVKAILDLSNAKHDSLPTCLVTDDRMLKRYVPKIPQVALDIIDLAEKPTTIIFDNAKNLASTLLYNDESAAFRIPNNEFCYRLSRKFNGALAVVAINNLNKTVVKTFEEIDTMTLKGVDYIVNLHREKIVANPASIIKLKNNGEVKIIGA